MSDIVDDRKPGDHISDCEFQGTKIPAELEKAYRRGFCQGAWTTYYSLLDGFSLDAIKAWLFMVDAWRRKTHGKRYGDRMLVEGPPDEPRRRP